MEAVATISAALIVIALLGIFWWVSRNSQATKLGWFSFSPRIRSGNVHPTQLTILARSQLTPQHQLHLIQAMEQTLLLCTYPNGSSVIMTRPMAQTTGISGAGEFPQ